MTLLTAGLVFVILPVVILAISLILPKPTDVYVNYLNRKVR